MVSFSGVVDTGCFVGSTKPAQTMVARGTNDEQWSIVETHNDVALSLLQDVASIID